MTEQVETLEMQAIKGADKQKRLAELKEKILKDGNDTYLFKSRLHELAFYFSKIAEKDTLIFDEELNIKRVHHKDSKKARELRKIYLSLFNSTRDSKEFELIGIDCRTVEANIGKTFNILTGGKLK